MYENNLLTKSFKASAAISPNTVVKFGAADDTVSPAIAATDLLLGVANELGATATDVTNGSLMDVTLQGIAELKIGAAVTRGQKLTVNASGQGIPAAPAAGVNNYLIGIAMKSGATNDIIPVLLHQGVLQG